MDPQTQQKRRIAPPAASIKPTSPAKQSIEKRPRVPAPGNSTMPPPGACVAFSPSLPPIDISPPPMPMHATPPIYYARTQLRMLLLLRLCVVCVSRSSQREREALRVHARGGTVLLTPRDCVRALAVAAAFWQVCVPWPRSDFVSSLLPPARAAREARDRMIASLLPPQAAAAAARENFNGESPARAGRNVPSHVVSWAAGR